MALAGVLDVMQMLRRQAVRIVIVRRMGTSLHENTAGLSRDYRFAFRLFAVPFAPRQLGWFCVHSTLGDLGIRKGRLLIQKIRNLLLSSDFSDIVRLAAQQVPQFSPYRF
jgi:hypothetical protein